MLTRNKPSGVLLDTHIWFRYIDGTQSLKPVEIAFIDELRQTGDAFVSIISIWEVALLVKKKRLSLPKDVETWIAGALTAPGIQLISLTPDVALDSVALPDALNRDPADRIIVATARVEGLRLMSHDKDILRFAKQTKLEIVKR